MKIIVIGGDAAGMSAASQIKRQMPGYEVTVFERGQYISYAACGIPYYIGGAVSRLDDLIEVSPQEAREKRKVDLRLGHTVTAIDTVGHTVIVEANGKLSEEPFDRIVIATGARPETMGMDLSEYRNAFTMNDLLDAGKIKRFIAEKKPGRIAVIGGGYIGIEAVEAFTGLGIETMLVHRRTELQRSFEQEISEIILKKMVENGVTLCLGSAVSGLEQKKEGIVVMTDTGPIECDAVLLAVGVVPNSELAASAGIPLGVKHAIRVNELMETGVKDVYAAGDCATSRMIGFPLEVHAPLALKANKQGMIAGMNAAGANEAFAGVMNTAIMKIFDLGISRTGLSYGQARDLGLDPEKVVVQSRDRARYYPGSETMTSLVIVSRKDRRILGAQMAGGIGSVKRIDVYSAAIHNGMTIDGLFDLDLAYAPPFSPVYDPVLMAARVARKKI